MSEVIPLEERRFYEDYFVLVRIQNASEDYKKLIDHIKTYTYWATPLKSVWFVKSSKSTSQVRDDIKSETDANDGLLVMNVTGSDWATTGISTKVTDWMKQNL